ncbi:hypothetical protein [Microvirga makkahensis]|uniref:Uncharacterized protein n=1 Tax=Microvirga makkahensis TaxID=1128670 RepID=A0A7X3MVW8_9HYPH|nr:hypothetical protein [Microvirga makkahensis]MXQ14197.1 hypothetical protein [Microvirga makkahensis]
MSAEEELKRKRAELLGEVDELVLRIVTIRKQVAAIDQVIAIYDPARPRFVTHVSAGLNSLVKRKRVRQVGAVDGRKNLWEIAA